MERFPSGAREQAPASTPSTQELVQEVDRLLATLPTEIQERLEKRIANLSPEDQRSEIEAHIRKRQEVLAERNRSSLSERPKHVEIEKSYPLAVARFVERIEGEHTFLGEGKTARVLASVRFPEVCYKVMFAKDKIPPETNSIAHEVDLQDEIASIGEVAGVRAPRVHMFIEEDGMRAIRMERLDAVSLRDLMDGTEAWPETFSFDSFFASLRTFIDAMHARGYHHRDLHEGNIMVDRVTGAARLIDFGLSTHTYDQENAYRFDIVEGGHFKQVMVPSDLGALEKIKMNVRVAIRGL